MGFLPMNIQDAPTVGRVLIAIDRANGYSFAADEALEMRKRAEAANASGSALQEEEKLRRLFSVASVDVESTYERSLEVYEKYVDKIDKMTQ